MDFIPSSNQLSDFRGLFYWGFIGRNFGDYKNRSEKSLSCHFVLSVTILETTKTTSAFAAAFSSFYRSQFWRLQKLLSNLSYRSNGFIGHNFGDYKNHLYFRQNYHMVLSVTILETTKTVKSRTSRESSVLSVTILETTKTRTGYSQ